MVEDKVLRDAMLKIKPEQITPKCYPLDYRTSGAIFLILIAKLVIWKIDPKENCD